MDGTLTQILQSLVSAHQEIDRLRAEIARQASSEPLAPHTTPAQAPEAL